MLCGTQRAIFTRFGDGWPSASRGSKNAVSRDYKSPGEFKADFAVLE